MNPLILRLKNSIDKSVLDSIDKNLLGLHLFVPISVKDNFLLYVNLENEKMHNCIMPSSQLDFESEHTVIKTNKRNDWQGYYKMRNKFFVDCVKEGETTAYQKVLTKTNG